MPHQPIGQLIPALLPKEGRRNRACQQPLRPDPADGLLFQGFRPTDPHRLGDARIEVSRLNERQQPRFQTDRPVRREIFERDARMREFADECGIVRHRRHNHDPDAREPIEQPLDQSGPKDVARRAAVRDRNEHREAGCRVCHRRCQSEATAATRYGA